MNERLKKLHATLGISPAYGSARRLLPQREAGRVIRVATLSDGRAVALTPRAAVAWRRMRDAAARDGVVLYPLSGFRSVARQTRIIRDSLAAGRPLAEILRLIAAPGFSEHHTGRALDLGTTGCETLEVAFARTAAFRWLARHAGEFGFRLSYPRNNPHAIAYEPWHWCWRR